MEEDKVLSIHDIVGSEFCIAAEDGQKVYENLKRALAKGCAVSLSFQSVKNISAIFLFTAIGQLYNGEFPEDDLKNKLTITDISPGRRILIERTSQRAREYFENPSRFGDEAC